MSQSSEQATSESRQSWMPNWLRMLWAIGVLLIVFLGGIVVGMLVERNTLGDKVVLGPEWSDLGDAISYLESDSYYRPQDSASVVQWQENIQSGAINGLLGASGDAYAAFLPPAEAARSSARLTGKYEGVGISIGRGEGGDVEVVSVMLDSPAERNDVRVGDVIAEVDSTPIPEGDTEAAAALLRGDAGTSVTLRLNRDGGDSRTLELTREVIETGEKTVTYQYFPDSGVGVIRIALFASTTPPELDSALALAREDGVERLVLDLRGNPGGWVTAAQEVIGRFLPESAGLALQEDTWPAGGKMVDLPIVNDGARIFEGNLIVLVDENTASAAEITAGALQDHDRATIVGQQSFGKGSVQRVYDFPGGQSLRLTIAEWFTPNGRRLQGAGIEPDHIMQVDAPIDRLVPQFAPLFASAGNAVTSTPIASPATTPAAIAVYTLSRPDFTPI